MGVHLLQTKETARTTRIRPTKSKASVKRRGIKKDGVDVSEHRRYAGQRANRPKRRTPNGLPQSRRQRRGSRRCGGSGPSRWRPTGNPPATTRPRRWCRRAKVAADTPMESAPYMNVNKCNVCMHATSMHVGVACVPVCSECLSSHASSLSEYMSVGAAISICPPTCLLTAATCVALDSTCLTTSQRFIQ